MSARAIILGLLGAIFIATVGYFNYKVPRLTRFGNTLLPIVVFLPLMLAAGLINPLLERIRPRWKFKGSELAVIAAGALVAVSISGSAVLRFWSRAVFMPPKFNDADVAWKKAEALQSVPPAMLANNGVYEAKLFQPAYEGMGQPGAPIGMGEIPWGMWIRPLVVWGPLIAMMAVGSICLAVVVHRQWSSHERLPYPVADLADSVVSGVAGKSIFSTRLFWVGAGVIFAIHLANGLNTFTHGKFIEIPHVFHFYQFTDAMPVLNEGGTWGWGLVHIALWPTLIAFACFVNDDVSFSLGISAVPYLIVGILMYQTGISQATDAIDGGPFTWQMSGSFLAIGVLLVYLGRRYYARLMGSVIGLGGRGDVLPYEAWAMRLLLLISVAMVLILTGLGLAWPFAILAVGLMFLSYLIFARIHVETGLVAIQTGWAPLTMMLCLFGTESLGLRTLGIIGMFYLVMLADPRDCVLPMVLNGLRMCQARKIPVARSGRGIAGLLVIALVVALPVGLWIDHNWGFSRGHNSAISASKGTFNFITRVHTELDTSGRLATSAAMTTLERATTLDPNWKAIAFIAAGFAAVLGLSALRLRYTWWPLHPVLLLVWGTYIMQELAYSFLLGWIIKRVATRLGVRWATLKTLMIGVIAGDLAGGALWMIVGAIWYGIYNERPPEYLILPK